MPATVADLAARVLRRLGVVAVAASERGPNPSGLVSFQDIGRLALQLLGVVAANETPEAADAEVATFKAQAVHHSLVGHGHVPWGNPNAVPSSMAEDYTRLVALHLAPMFGKQSDPKSIPLIEARIQRISLVERAPALAAQAVQDVHSWLDGTGRARWSLFDLPDYAEGPYVALAAARLARAFEVRPDPLDEVRALRELAQAIALPSSGEPMRPEYF